MKPRTAPAAAAPRPGEYSEDAALLERDGYLVLPGLLDPHELSVLQRELEPWLERTPRCQGNFYGWRTTRVGGLLSKAPIVQMMALNPRILAIANTLLAPACDCIQLNLTQATRVHPGEDAQAPHRDEEMWPNDTQGRHWLINVMWAASDFTAQNGATRVWARSHRHALDRRVEEEASMAVAMPAGSALIFLGSLTHGAGANMSTLPRTGVIVSYCLGWLKTYENQFLAYPRDVVRTFPEPLQRLIGYRMHRPNLGGWEGRDPIEALDDDGAPKPHVDALPPDLADELAAYCTERHVVGRGGDGC